MTIRISYTTTRNPDLGARKFFVEAGRLFDADDYADAYKLNRPDFDAADVHAAQDAAGHLCDGEWLEISHEIEEN